MGQIVALVGQVARAFYLSRPARVTLHLRTVRGDDVRTVLEGASFGAGLHQETMWDGLNGTYVADIDVFADGVREHARRKVAVVR